MRTAGAGGFIGSHLAKRLKADGFYVVGADWKENEFMTQDEFCDEFMLVDLRDKDNCLKATKDCADVYNLAADMGGMGFIQVRGGRPACCRVHGRMRGCICFCGLMVTCVVMLGFLVLAGTNGLVLLPVCRKFLSLVCLRFLRFPLLRATTL